MSERPYQLREWIIMGVFGPMTTGHWKEHSFPNRESRDGWASGAIEEARKVWGRFLQVEIRDPGEDWKPWEEEDGRA